MNHNYAYSNTYPFPQLKMHLQKRCSWIKQFFRTFVFLCCFGIVIWQCWRCLEKFLSKPQVTQLSIVKSAGNMFPSVTVCPATSNNSTILSDCGITRHQYYREAIWSNQDIDGCSDPEQLFYSTTWKLEDLISEVQVKSFNNSANSLFDNKAKFFYPVDRNEFGRCYTFLPPKENLRDGIFRIIFVFKAKVMVLVNSNGVFSVNRDAVETLLNVSPNKSSRIKVEHSLYKMLDFQGVPCNNEKDYRLDKCILEGLEEESLKTIGCVTPFGITKDRICQNEQDSKTAFQLYFKHRDNEDLSCLEPCSYMSVKRFKGFEMEKKDNKGDFALAFDKNVHETVAHYSYDDLSFIAEIGGYVGLFLGASVYQTADLFQFIAEALEKLFE